MSLKTRFIQTSLNQRLFEQVKLTSLHLDLPVAALTRRALVLFLEQNPIPNIFNDPPKQEVVNNGKNAEIR